MCPGNRQQHRDTLVRLGQQTPQLSQVPKVDACGLQPVVHPELPIGYRPLLAHKTVRPEPARPLKFRESAETEGQV
jgi:hypothetical protein